VEAASRHVGGGAIETHHHISRRHRSSPHPPVRSRPLAAAVRSRRVSCRRNQVIAYVGDPVRHI
jgi:hypothetical protein